MKSVNAIRLLTAAVLVIVGYLLFRDFYSKEPVVYVDSQKLVNGYKGMQDARKEYEQQTFGLRANLDTLRLELEGVIARYNSNATQASVKEKKLTEELIQVKRAQYIEYQRVVEEKIKSFDQELSSKVLRKVNDFINHYGDQNGYDIIIAATQYGNVVYGNKKYDVTDDILKGLNDEYGK